MIPSPPSPILIQIGPLAIRWYAVLLLSGALLAAWIAARLAPRYGEDPDLVWDILLYVLIGGILGARLYHVISAWDYYRQNPADILATWKGGLGIFGAVAGGILTLWILSRIRRFDLWRWVDLASVGLPLAQAIGRWGNWFNQEAYGKPTNASWGLYIAPENRLPGLEGYSRFHPTFLYESLWNFGTFLVLYWLATRRQSWLKKGDLFLVYAILYPAGRFWVEAFRADSWTWNGIPVAQIWSAAAVLVAGGILVWRHRR